MVKGPGTVIFNRLLRVGAQKLQVLDLLRRACLRIFPTMRGTGLGCPERSSAVPGLSMVHAFERGGETVGVALAPDLPVGDDVQSRFLLGADREQAVASCSASARSGSGMRHSSFARTRGGKRPASFFLSISHSGCG